MIVKFLTPTLIEIRFAKISRSVAIATLVLFTASACQPQTSNNSVTNSSVADNKSEPSNGTEAPYAIGSKTFFIHDKSRSFDSVAGVNVGVRSLLTEVWYPVEHDAVVGGEYSRATYGDYVFRDKAIHRLMMTQTTFFHLTPESVVDGVSSAEIDTAIDELFDRSRASYIDAPLASSEKSRPVVVMTHGDAGSRYNMESACEYLAAHGYVVIAPEHTGNTPFALTIKDPEIDTSLADVKPLLNADGTYGPVDNYGQTYTPLIRDRSNPQAMVNLDNSLLERVNDLRAVLSALDSMNQSGSFAKQLDLDKVGLMGRSFGGTTTLAALALEPRFSAGVAVVPMVLPDMRKGFPAELLKPENSESVILSSSGDNALHRISKPTMLLSGAEDSLIIGVGAAMASAIGGEVPTLENPLPELRRSYEQTTQPVIWGLLENSNHSSFGVSGGYWWPNYKPSSQKRFFNPEQSFQLVNVETAHQIQKQKVMQFFDLMIRGDKAVKNALLQNEFVEQGLQYESRNFSN